MKYLDTSDRFIKGFNFIDLTILTLETISKNLQLFMVLIENFFRKQYNKSLTSNIRYVLFSRISMIGIRNWHQYNRQFGATLLPVGRY